MEGRIEEDFYQRLQHQWREERDRCNDDLARLDTADDSYFNAGLLLLKLGQEAQKAFQTKSAEREQSLLKFVLSNRTWSNGELTSQRRTDRDLQRTL